MVDRESGRSLLYDLVKDPKETHNVFRLHPHRFERMKQQLDLWSKAIELKAAEHTDGRVPKLSSEEIEAMRSLGYIQ